MRLFLFAVAALLSRAVLAGPPMCSEHDMDFSPDDGAVDVPVNAAVLVRKVRSCESSGLVEIVDVNGVRVPVRRTADDWLMPDAPLQQHTTYVLENSNGITWASFRTGGRTVVPVATAPAIHVESAECQPLVTSPPMTRCVYEAVLTRPPDAPVDRGYFELTLDEGGAQLWPESEDGDTRVTFEAVREATSTRACLVARFIDVTATRSPPAEPFCHEAAIHSAGTPHDEEVHTSGPVGCSQGSGNALGLLVLVVMRVCRRRVTTRPF